jgi:hypothetical protein
MLNPVSTSPTPTRQDVPSIAERISQARWVADLAADALDDLVSALADLDAADVPEELRDHVERIVIEAECASMMIAREVAKLREPDDDGDLDQSVEVSR